jgi:large subunit ribosomal protein L3
VQVTFGKRRASRVNKASAGHLAKAAVEAGHVLREFRVPESELGNLKLGGKIGVDIFKVGQKVDVSGMSQGKGFAGVIKRHHFSSNRASHGNSLSTNKPGSTGMAQDPGRVFPGKRMAGHLGAAQRTVQGLEVVRVDAERQLLLIKGSVPGSRGRDIVVRPTTKATRVKGPSPKAAPSKAATGAAKAAPAPKATPAPAAKAAAPAPAAKGA